MFTNKRLLDMIVPMTDPLVLRSETGSPADAAPKRCVLVPHSAGTYDVSPTFAAIDYDQLMYEMR